MSSDVILNKIASIEKCVSRICEEYDGYEDTFQINFTKQDSVILNLERASQATIDIATHIIKNEKFGLPNSSRKLFSLLEENHIITQDISQKMQSMVGFRNIAVHDYQNISVDIVVSIIEKHLVDFEFFIKEIFENYLDHNNIK